jgi:Ca2+/H+ antiporter
MLTFKLWSDFFEVAILLAACFIVNYVTADAKTNWAEGYAMVSFYVMIVSEVNPLIRTILFLFCVAL